jgi:hypothetical protein
MRQETTNLPDDLSEALRDEHLEYDDSVSEWLREAAIEKADREGVDR